MTSSRPSAAAEPAKARRRAGPASSAGVTSVSAAPALAAEVAANKNGSSVRASCHTGTAVSAISAAV